MDDLLKRALDILLASLALVLTGIPMVLIGLCIKLSSPGPVIYWSDRVGRNNIIFRMPKFRTMQIKTPAVATHLLHDPDAYLTPVGGIIRRTSLDELPQLWSILVGSMSIVGPRPALYNQDDLIGLRTAAGVDKLIPGLTGWAQINGRDELSVAEKVELDIEYMRRRSFVFDIKIIYMSIINILRRQGVSH